MFTPEPQKVLIVDESQANVMVLCDALKDYNCIIATNGEKALKIAHSDNKPDLILLDIIMEGMDGYEVCSKLKKDNKTRDIPVIFLTGQTAPEYLIKGFNVGAVDFITKPFNIDELTIRVSTQLKYKKTLDDNARYLKSIEDIYDTITDSMYYAQRIQNATLPHRSYLDKLMNDYFVIFKPRDIVSGDFYLANKIHNKLLLVVADCTGHGVPGALMSMMSMAIIKDIINAENIIEPPKILNLLRKTIISTFYGGGDEVITDGLDASIVQIDLKTGELKYSGANLPIYIIRNNDLIEIKGDRMPVGSYPKQAPFSQRRYIAQEGDCIYLFSDGFADQFGGKANRKMMHRNFKNTILKYHHLKMDKQKNRLEQYFADWKGFNEQIDDVLLMGYRFTYKNKA